LRRQEDPRAHTFHHGTKAFRPNQETKLARKATSRALRRANRALAHALRRGQAYDSAALPVHQRTSGWVTH
jgi:hypothetical protein